MDKIEQQDSVYVNDETIYNKKIKLVDPPGRNIGIDIDHDFLDNIISAGLNSTLDMAKLQSFTLLSQNRDTIYLLIDTMSEDPTISAALEIYAEDTTETNEFGRIVWCESENPDIVKFVTYLLDTMNVEKNIYRWVYSLCKYGDLYLRLFRESEMEDSLNIFDKKNKRDKLNEEVKIHVDKKDDHFSHYIEMVPNPAEMFELTRHGKSCGYIKADVMPTTLKVDMLAQSYFRYQFREKDVTVYEPTNFVHACLEDNSSRVPEEVDIFLDNNTKADTDSPDITYTVRRGQPIFYNAFKVWRCMMLLENSLLLNRITKSSILRIIGVEVGDMDKTSVGPHLMNIKLLIEQKAAFDVGNSMEEYTNPGPVENNIYVPTHNGIGAISTLQVGGDVDVKGLADLDYFNLRFYTALRIPKLYLGCLRGNTDILLLNGKHITIEELYNNKLDYIGKGIMACNPDGSLCPTVISDIMLTKPSTSFLRIHLDNGSYVDVTHDHRMMLRDGRYILAEDLNVGDSLMPYYDYILDGRRYVLDNKSGKYRPQYRVVAESVCDIPKGYQVHHINSVKINDDFDNLIPLTVADHYTLHVDMLHQSSRDGYLKRRENGEVVSKHVGAKMINNGVRLYWLSDEDELPVGYVYGMLPFTLEHKDNIGNALRGKSKNYDCAANFGEHANEKCLIVKAQRLKEGLYDEQYRKHSECMKELAKNKLGWHSQEAYDKKMAHIPENRCNKSRYVRCLCCGKTEEIKCNDDWYNDYLNEDCFWFCDDECLKLNGRGKLPRSYKLYKESMCDPELYEYNRWHNEYRPDYYFKYDTLETKLPYLEDYVPECNHKVVAIEFINVSEPAYDISVAADCHTFALPCGIFVHNCTDDATGFNGGTALSIISSRYAKMVKRILNTVTQCLTDIVNLMIIDKGNDAYINNFTLHMLAPATEEEATRRDNRSSELQTIRDIMDLLSDMESIPVKLEILKTLLANVISDADILQMIQDEIDRLELENPEEVSDESSDDTDIDIDMNGSFGGGGDFDEPELNDLNIDTGEEETMDMEEPTGEETVLPTPNELNPDIDFSDNTTEI